MIVLDAANFPKTQRQVLDQLIGEIDSGNLKIGDSLGGEVALAGRLGVSRNTIRSLLGTLRDAGAVRQVPRRGIFLNSHLKVRIAPNNAAPGGDFIYVHWADNLMEAEISSGLQRFARRHALEIRFLSMRQSEGNLVELLDSCDAPTTVVLMPLETDAVVAAIRRALARKVRILQIDRYLPGLATPSIVFDDYAVGALGTRHLIRQSSGPVWFFGYIHPVSAERRFLGWRDSMLEAGFRNWPDYIVPCGYDDPRAEMRPESFYLDAFREFYSRRLDEPLAIFCIGDTLALNVYAAAAQFGRRVGRDIRLVGSGDTACGRRQDPPLSSIHADQEQMGEAIGQLLLRWPAMNNYCQILPLELIARESSLGPETP